VSAAPSAEITLRPARPADAPTLAAFNTAMALETEGKHLNPQTVLRGVQAVFDEPSLGFYVVAEAEGQVVAGLMITTEWSDWRAAHFWWIQSVYVQPAWRRQGIFRRLYGTVRQMALQRVDVCGLRLYVEGENLAGQQTYEALGMSQTSYALYEEMLVSQ
jgi:GNAT superfamily N-acetyltransferase